MTATSATGICQGPTIWSRATCPETLRSPIVIRKFFAATPGSCSTRSTTSSSLSDEVSKGAALPARRVASIASFGGLPKSTSIGKATGDSPSVRSVTTISLAAVASPTMAQGQRSRAQIASKRARRAGSIAST